MVTHDTEYLFDYDARTIHYLNQRGIEEGWPSLRSVAEADRSPPGSVREWGSRDAC
jgi:hypothetical protein